MRAMLGMPVLDFPTRVRAPTPTATCRRASPRATRTRQRRGSSFSLAPARALHGRRRDAARRSSILAAASSTCRSRRTCRRRAPSSTTRCATPARRRSRASTAWASPGPRSSRSTRCIRDRATSTCSRAQACHVVHCPSSNLKLASGIAPVAGYLARGINVALGTDGAASNNRLDLFGEMRLAALLAKVASGDAAASAGRGRRCGWPRSRARGRSASTRVIGSLEPGKDADVDRGRPRAARDSSPCYDPVSHLVHAAGREHVTDVWVDGERARRASGRLTTLDAAAIAARAARVARVACNER